MTEMNRVFSMKSNRGGSKTTLMSDMARTAMMTMKAGMTP